MSGQAFIETGTILDTILAHKLVEVAERRAQVGLPALQAQAAAAPPARDFAAALRRDTVTLIAEVKKASPSKGVLIENFDPVALATTYAQNGASAISVLTDERFFQGGFPVLETVRRTVDLPLLCKEFILDPYQVYQGRAAGADAALLIVMALDDTQLRDLHDVITGLGMAALVEVHNEVEMERALRCGATLIGVNNRDLRTFHEDLHTTERLARMTPPGVTLVAESAIRSADDVWRMGSFGARAVLVGEGLVKAADIAQQVRLFSSQPCEVNHASG
ncbi:MAG: indole-3-glycerol phosphate synthase TrpC [Anaerolineae bacterium]|nr:indole-3-glycerol phosphate synthase TrpC [Anaerolineae bacterium]